MFEGIMKFFNKLTKKEEKIASSSKDTAKERLHLVLMQDRANVSADFLELMKQEIIEVIKKYIDIDEGAIDVRLTNKENEDGTNGAPALYANIPILNIKNDARKVEKQKEIIDKNENIKEEKEKKEDNKDIKLIENNEKDKEMKNNNQETENKEENKNDKKETSIKNESVSQENQEEQSDNINEEKVEKEKSKDIDTIKENTNKENNNENRKQNLNKQNSNKKQKSKKYKK